MKKLGLLLLIMFLVSCNTNKDVWNTQTGSQATGTIENLTTNNDTNMTNIQTKALENWDVVAIMKTTNGTMTIKLFTDLVPVTTTNFIWLAKKGYYNNVTFHRVINNFMIQWWDPTATGMWWESIFWKEFEDEFSKELSNIPYSISMANAWANTNWSQFFINQVDNSRWLDNKHSVFWQVVEWIENVDKIAKVKTDSSDKPEKEVKIVSLEIKEYNNGTFKDITFDLDAKLKEIEANKLVKKEAMKNKVVEAWDTVDVHYTGTFENWEKFDSSLDRWTPISFTVWAGKMIKWFDAWVVWMKIGDKKTLKLAPKDAYWEYDKNNTQVVPKTQLKSFTDAWIKLEVWAELPTQMWNLKILAVDDKNVTIDGNSPMAGKTLNFDIELVDVK